MFSIQTAEAREAGRAGVYSVAELSFQGPVQSPTNSPARDIEFWARFRHGSGGVEYKIHGFWDGDGKGGASGPVFKIRFCPTRPGRWNLVETYSSSPLLKGQKQGDHVTATLSSHRGFWEVDAESTGRRWYKRSDGSHSYIFGNTHYSFLSETYQNGTSSGSDIASDIRSNARYFKKLRFSAIGDRYPHQTEAPFFEDSGKATYDGDYSFRLNPGWFHRRVDRAVQTAYDLDLIADLILSGVDLESTRSALQAAGNGGDPGPFLRYLAARYGAYPNVWFCLINEFDLYGPIYTGSQTAQFGQTMKSFLPYPSPLSVHKSPGVWMTSLNTIPPWNDHIILQQKLRRLDRAADTIGLSYEAGGRNKPVVNDELSYQGDGDKHSESDTIESHLGAFLGAGYASTGYKSVEKLGQYFPGNFDVAAHTSAENLRWLREFIDADIRFWKMAPDRSLFKNLDPEFRGMAWADQEYVLGTNKRQSGIVVPLPDGVWTVTLYDVIHRTKHVLKTDARGAFTFAAPDSRAALFHFRKNESQ